MNSFIMLIQWCGGPNLRGLTGAWTNLSRPLCILNPETDETIWDISIKIQKKSTSQFLYILHGVPYSDRVQTLHTHTHRFCFIIFL